MLDQGLAGRWTAELCAGYWNRPSWLWSPSLASKWLAMTNTSLPLKANSPASGLRLADHTELAGSIRPGDRVSVGSPFFLVT